MKHLHLAASRFKSLLVAVATPALASGLATAVTLFGGVYPLSAQEIEVGEDLRISHMGFTGQTVEDGIGAFQAAVAVAHNATDDEYLVVWSGVDDLDLGREIYIRRLDAQTGEALSEQIRISDTGVMGDTARKAQQPRVAWDSLRNRYLVVWYSDDESVDNEYEVRGQLIEADGSEAGAQDFLISQTGVAGDPLVGGRFPDVLYDPNRDDYFVVWNAQVTENDADIVGQHISAAFPLVLTFSPDLVGGLASAAVRSRPRVVFNSVHNEYLVVWHSVLFEESLEVARAQRIRASDRVRVGILDRRISADETPFSFALYPDVAYDPFDDKYLIVWNSTWSPLAGGFPFDAEVRGQLRTGSTVGPIGPPIDHQFTSIGPPGDLERGSTGAAIAFDLQTREYLLVFHGDEASDDEFQVRGMVLDQRADRLVPTNDQGVQLSEMDGSGPDYDGLWPAVASAAGRLLVVWEGDDDRPGIGDNDQDFEIYGQRVVVPGIIFADGFETGGFCDNDWVEFPPQCIVP